MKDHSTRDPTPSWVGHRYWGSLYLAVLAGTDSNQRVTLGSGDIGKTGCTGRWRGDGEGVGPSAVIGMADDLCQEFGTNRSLTEGLLGYYSANHLPGVLHAAYRSDSSGSEMKQAQLLTLHIPQPPVLSQLRGGSVDIAQFILVHRC